MSWKVRSKVKQIIIWGLELLMFSCSVVFDSLGPNGLQHARLPCLTISWSMLKRMSIESVMPSCPLSPLLLLSSISSGIRAISNELALCIRWPNYWSFSPFSGYSGLISFRIDWLDLLAVQGTLKSPLQHHISKISILWHSALFMVQLAH